MKELWENAQKVPMNLPVCKEDLEKVPIDGSGCWLKGLAQAKNIKKLVILFRVLNMTI